MFFYLKKSLKYYFENFSSVQGFGLLLVFVLFFMNFSSIFFSTGSVFFDYSFLQKPSIDLLLLFAGMLVFFFFYSLFVVLIVFSVRNHLSRVKTHYYLTEKIRLFALKYFVFLCLSAFFSFLAWFFFGIFLGVKILAFIAMFALFFVFLFLPQAIVVDEQSLFSSIQNTIDFFSKNMPSNALVFFTTLVFFYAAVLSEFILNYFFMPGEFFSLLFLTVFVVPFIEILKTVYYMQKFGLVKSTSLALD